MRQSLEFFIWMIVAYLISILLTGAFEPDYQSLGWYSASTWVIVSAPPLLAGVIFGYRKIRHPATSPLMLMGATAGGGAIYAAVSFLFSGVFAEGAFLAEFTARDIVLMAAAQVLLPPIGAVAGTLLSSLIHS